MWSLVDRGLLAGVVGPKPMAPTTATLNVQISQGNFFSIFSLYLEVSRSLDFLISCSLVVRLFSSFDC